LDLLQINGRIQRNELAESVKLSIPAVSERLRKLEESAYITGYSTVINAKKLGLDITAFIIVTIDTSKHYHNFIDHSNQTEEILECHAITGEGSHLIKVRSENTTTLEKLLAKIQSWAGVTGTRTLLVLSTSKETTRIQIPHQITYNKRG
jgi:Lrp/AsnC family transcriptional regulator, leucine-responsive regulatory protein